MIDFSKGTFIYDIETDGLLDNVTKIHCLSVTHEKDGTIKTWSTSSYEEMKEFFLRDIIRVGHNITLYDERVIEKILGVKPVGSIVDTLCLSWYLYPENMKHSLEEWGKKVGVLKVEITDWTNLTTQEYIERCEKDTLINYKIWKIFERDLQKIYEDQKEVARLIDYLQFKMDCLREQEETKLRVDLERLNKNLDILEKAKQEKSDILKAVMPKVPIYKKSVYKNVVIGTDGQVYTKGDLMYEHMKSQGCETKQEHVIQKVIGWKEPNPNSVDQKKDWLFSLGWVPANYKTVKDGDSERRIPQITSVNNDGICQSVKDLFSKEPKLEALEGLSILSHRIGLLEGIKENQKDGFIEASALGFTNTLRLRHTNVVNLPGVKKKYGEEVRGVFIANGGMILCGSDMSSLEDSTKQHYIYNFDPQYVTDMRVPGFDPHLDIAVLSGLMTKEQADEHKLYEKTKGKEGVSYKEIRHKAKTTNFSATYGAGPPKIAATANISLKEAKLLHKIYWQRNSAVKKTAESSTVKEINGKKWLFNPVSRFWYSLRAEKDRFSTLNQGTGVYCFDQYIKAVRKRGIKISLQMHDEILFNLKEEDKDRVMDILKESIAEVNETVKLNVQLSISMDFGHSYADCH